MKGCNTIDGTNNNYDSAEAKCHFKASNLVKVGSKGHLLSKTLSVALLKFLERKKQKLRIGVESPPAPTDNVHSFVTYS